jgi:hypothetical protein
MNWSERQASFARALSDPALPAPDIFASCDAETRFNVYRNNVAVARVEALKAQFPVVCSFVGDEFFVGMSRAFMQAHPARSPLLSEYGAELPDFIAEFAPASGLPCLADLARLEWFCLQALGAADCPAFSLEQLAATEPEALLDAQAKFHPAFGLLSSIHPIVSIWSAHHEDRLASIQDWSPETAMVVRPDAEVVVRACPAGAAAFVAAAAGGASMREAAAAGASADGEFDFGQALVELVAIGAIAELHPGQAGMEIASTKNHPAS